VHINTLYCAIYSSHALVVILSHFEMAKAPLGSVNLINTWEVYIYIYIYIYMHSK